MIWKRRLYKKNAKKAVKHNYWYLIGICFIVAIVTSEGSRSLNLLNNYSESRVDVDEDVQVANAERELDIAEIVTGDSNYESDLSTFKGIVYELEINLLNALENDDSITANVSTFVIKTVIGMKKDSYIAFEVLLLLGLIITASFYIFVKSVFLVGKRYYLLENRDTMYTDTKVPMIQVLYGFQKKYWINIAKVMFFKWLRLGLWSITIIGYPIKYYEYKMIPYILADNPEIGTNEAFKLAKAMAKGYKFKMFILELSFVGWRFLEALSLGLVGLFYFEAYNIATECEVYLALRMNIMQKDSEVSKAFDNGKYTEAMEEYKAVADELGFVAREVKKATVVTEKYAIAIFNKLNPMRKYKLSTYILFFFTFSVVGWLYEVAIHLVKDGVFVNRGVCYGPWLPIYGTGAVVAIFFLKRFSKKPFFTFFAIMFTSSIIEYFTSWYLEYTKGIRWWDYSGYFCNLNGRIFLGGAIIFGIGGVMAIYVVGPLLANIYEKIAKPIVIVICSVLVGFFTVDKVYSSAHPNVGKGITDYDNWQEDSSSNNIYNL